MTCWESEGEEFLLPEAGPPDFCVVGREREPFPDEACLAPTEVDDFDPAGKGESGMGLEDTGVPETAEGI
jgi:hypothetical protein